MCLVSATSMSFDSVFALFPQNKNFQVDLTINNGWSQTWAKNQSGGEILAFRETRRALDKRYSRGGV